MEGNAAGSVDAGQVWVIQPRRLAARSVAEFLARSLGEPVGRTFGYHVRLDRKESDATRILMMTTGMFLRRMQSDPLLERASCVILDEFHERSLELDLSLALTQRLRTQLRDDLRLIVMSATLDPGPIAAYLGPQAIALACEGRSYPVEIQYHEAAARVRLETAIVPLIRAAIEATSGHVLVFLPGVADIQRVQRALGSEGLNCPVSIVPLHGSLSPTEQDAAVGNHASGARKIILSTNIAETSVTVDGVTAVVDSGLAKIPQVDSRLGLTRLQTLPISIASADQRAGRAGRTAPGVCFRMGSAAAHRTRDSYDRPEIARGDLAAAVLTLASLGETDFAAFSWLTPPPEHAVDAATQLLRMLGAIDASRRITTLGAQIMSLPLHPRIARFAAAAIRHEKPERVGIAAALLSEREPIENPSTEVASLSLAEKANWIASHPKSVGHTFRSVVRQIQRSLEQLEKLDRNIAPSPAKSGSRGDSRTDVISRALLAAYPDRVVMRRDGDRDRGVMVGRRGVIGLASIRNLDPSARFLLCYDMDGGETQSRVRAAIEVDESWLSPDLITSGVDVDFDTDREAIFCRSVRRYADLVMKETPVACETGEATATRLYDEAVLQPERVLPQSAPGGENDFHACLHRIGLVREFYRPDSAPENFDAGELFHDVCRELCHSRRSFAELRKAPWKDHLIGWVGYDFWQVVQRESPTHLTLPSGNRVRIGYAPDRAPWIEVKIQECFGWPRTPRILGGKVAVQMHLLGPNRRPQQITEDLQSFWDNTYPEIRKELRRRYPKHHWPEDPRTAVATPNGLKPRER